MKNYLSKFIFLVLVLSSCQKEDPAFEAREKIAKLGLAFSASAFMESVIKADELAVTLFLEAGMSPDTEADILEFYKKNGVVEESNLPLVMPVLLVAKQRKFANIEKLLLDYGANPLKLELAKRQIIQRLEKKPPTLVVNSSLENSSEKEFLKSLREKIQKSEKATDEKLKKLEGVIDRIEDQ